MSLKPNRLLGALQIVTFRDPGLPIHLVVQGVMWTLGEELVGRE